ncbi:MAG: sigma 54-interacting transcriptional regulator [Syntrophaceae bacterium]|nr:sigma 54-interacting transcriptional regulator [Syntrophaceae bacterium]
MSGLMSVGKDVQNIADAIASVIGVDVTIVDENLIRVAGTGAYSSLAGQAVDGSSVFRKVLETGKGYLIENPRTEALCEDCGIKSGCIEYGEISTPIVIAGKAIGIIGLIAFSKEQKVRLFTDKASVMEFLERMADLLAAKVLEREKTSTLEVMTNQMNIIINSIDEGIIATDSSGEIIRYNEAANILFNLRKHKHPVKISRIFGEFGESGVDYSRISDIKNREFLYQHSSYYIRGVFSAKPIVHDANFSGLVFTIREISQIHKVINDTIGSTYSTSFDTIIGESPAIIEIKDRAMKAAKSSSTVLIHGESGTGKELFARAIHSASPRKNKPFVAINCAAIPEQLLESELFGYEEGAFTGAVRGGRSGKFELADGGTVFLDEIGDMPLHLQVKLLRVLQERKIDRVGGKIPIPIDVRIIAATNSDLENRVSLGEFREDLFFRLNVIPLHIPSLAERKEDIPILMDYLLDKCNSKLGKAIEGFSDEVLGLFLKYNWKGNVRELENAIEYAVNMEQGKLITLSSLPLRMRDGTVKHSDGKSNGISALEDMEREMIDKAIRTYESKEKAAQALGIGRATLFRKIKKYGLG